ncbi:MAG: 2,3-bisphosphoglycerate-independent phosphoglycerate mutase [Alphaproteobacteria bacterium]|nr:2,3-bisphosphoglycerate-independent phosphoglycerate mutase [Alphaproteobacteria bacterium]
MPQPIVLCILDGVGIAPTEPHNAITLAKMPFYRELFRKYPHTALSASGTATGLTRGIMGNSEVGHITIGAGRIVNQFLRRFQIEQESGNLSHNPNLQKFTVDVTGVVHILGLCSDGRVHADLDQAILIGKIIAAKNFPIVWHFISDGRDTPPQSALKYIRKIERAFSSEIKAKQFRFGTLSGRYYAMDRNNNLDRTGLAFDAIARGMARFTAKNIKAAVANAYARGETDEFIKPTVIDTEHGTIGTKDGLLFFNYRSDRTRQILKMFIGSDFQPPKILCFSQYGEGLDEICPALLSDVPITNTLGDVLAASGLSQLRIAETEKYNHVTYFFDAERTIDYPNGEKILVPSPAVATFDMKPEMSAVEITDMLLPRLSEFDVVILNYANGDMLGHTGNKSAAIRGLETLDKCLSRLVPAILELDGTIIVTADHGNAEKMWNEKLSAPWTAHTTNKVPFILVENRKIDAKNRKLRTGGLADIAPTILEILGLSQPIEMTGKSLLK